MWNAAFHEYFLFADESDFSIKINCLGLRMQHYPALPTLPRCRYKPCKYRRAYSATAVLRNDRNSGNLTGRLQTAGANCVTFFRQYKHMRTLRIKLVPFVGGRNFLFIDKDGLSNFP